METSAYVNTHHISRRFQGDQQPDQAQQEREKDVPPGRDFDFFIFQVIPPFTSDIV